MIGKRPSRVTGVSQAESSRAPPPAAKRERREITGASPCNGANRGPARGGGLFAPRAAQGKPRLSPPAAAARAAPLVRRRFALHHLHPSATGCEAALVQITSPAFKRNAARALGDAGLQKALGKAKGAFLQRRAEAVARLPEFEALREIGRDIKNHTLANLDVYLEIYAANVERAGGTVHWCSTAEEARAAVLEICRKAGARTVTKGKSMISEEIALNDHLERHGITPVETDLGEYIIQLRGEHPSHIIAPAFHLNREDWEADFRRMHTDLPADRVFHERRDILAEARTKLRERFLAADVGITGANFLIAETGSSVIVTNEGNGDLTQTLPRVHIALASIEKVVPTLEDACTLLRLLARSATGQDFSVYTTFSTGGRRPGDLDGPEEYHVVLIDNGRSNMIGTEFQEMLRCIRCAACMNHCPVYGVTGGHAYGWVYPGPMGSVLTPSLVGVDKAGHLPNASTFCGKCESVCPMKIPLPKMMRHWREREFERHLTPAAARRNLGLWAWFAKRPGMYRLATRAAVGALRLLGRGKGAFRSLPLAGGWTAGRDLPVPEGGTFMARYARMQRGR
ncbi:iron-sulfur cluster-binding protein [Roseomonas alkaliterrae]|nr:iron-sulfur cluster-binding protein [Neoroseomonas alkaliterrae]